VSDITRILKEEISRLARKEIRAETERLKKASVQYRSDIAALKRQVADLEKQLGRASKQPRAVEIPAPGNGEDVPHRFSVKGLKSLRARLEVSAADFARLLGVSPQTIYNWETDKTHPRADQIAAIAGLRTIGKREVRARLDAAPAE
jgi:DNA-binding XRE family transcriptional regulator